MVRCRSVLGDRLAGDHPAHGQRRRIDIASGAGRGQREHHLPALVVHLEVEVVGAVELHVCTRGIDEDAVTACRV